MDSESGPIVGVLQDGSGSGCGQVPALFSLIVPTLGRFEDVARLLGALARQTDRRFEVIIVDQNKGDGLVRILEDGRRNGLEIVHVRLEKSGATLARNAGFRRSRGDIIAFPDDDCWYEPDVVERARSFFAAEPGTAGLLAHWVERDPERQRTNGSFSPDAWRRFKGGDAACFALFFRREAFAAVGGFSESFGPGRFFGCAEEEDLILTMLARGFALQYRNDISIHHFHADRPMLDARQLRRNRWYGRGTGGVLAKHKMPVWVKVRGIAGPIYHAMRAPGRAHGLILASSTVLGRIEGMVGWTLWGRRHAGVTTFARPDGRRASDASV